MNKSAFFSTVVCLTGTACLSIFQPEGQAQVGKDAEWLSYGRTGIEQRYSPLTQISSMTVKGLGLAWWAEFDTNRGQEATPLVSNGVLYTTTAWSKVYAFNAGTGAKLWSFDPKVPGKTALFACCDVVNRGAALWKDRVIVGTLDGRLISLDAKTGKAVWSVQTTDPGLPYTITGAPRVINDKIIIGNGGAEYGVRGYVSAYDAQTGKLAWRFYTTPNPEGKSDGAVSDGPLKRYANSTWFGDVWKKSGGGGTVWDSMAYDKQTGLLYIGVGNGAPWNHFIRSEGRGDNLFVSSILALRPETGEYVWHYQVTPGDTWDYTATQTITVGDVTIDGKKRRVVMQAPKNGFFYVLDAFSGKLISADKFAPWADWASAIDPVSGRPIEAPGARWGNNKASFLNPGPIGAHNWKPMAFNPQLGLAYIPAQDNAFNYSGTDNAQDYRQTNGVWNLGMGRQGVGGIGYNGGDVEPRPQASTPAPKQTAEQQRAILIAWDPARQKARWSVEHGALWGQGGVLAANDVVVQGVGQALKAFSASDGKALWSYDMGAPAIAAPMTYALNGVQYIAVMIGNGGGASTGDPLRPGRLMVFKLGGKAQASAFALPRIAPLVNVADAEPSNGIVAEGATNFRRYCGVCHGSSNIYPDLRRSRALLSQKVFKAVVHDGAMQSRGMAAFSPYMTERDVEAIRAYLISQYAKPVS